MRLDVFLSENGMVKSRSMAAECIKNGLVTVNGSVVSKASYNVTESDKVVILGTPHNYVGRGGLKLEGALDTFGINVNDMCAIDIGASTGGFTDCLLKKGAARVVALDSGHGQLDESLVNNSFVTNMEGFNARDLTSSTFDIKFDIGVSDVSFISQTLILEPVHSVLKDGGIYIGLIKPQFECGASALNKNGIVKDRKDHKRAINNVVNAGISCGFSIMGIAKSPITGGDGNKEFLVYMIKDGEKSIYDDFTKDLNEVCI